MKLFLLCLLLTGIGACRSHGFDSDKRQIIAKDRILEKNPQMHHFRILGFNEDTLTTPYDANLTRPIAYTIDYAYTDSTQTERRTKGVVLFDPSGKAVLRTDTDARP